MQYQVAHSRTKNSKLYEPMTGIEERRDKRWRVVTDFKWMFKRYR